MISKISNYVVDSKYDKPRMSMSYISFYEESVETIRLNNIKENRNISVDVLLGERTFKKEKKKSKTFLHI